MNVKENAASSKLSDIERTRERLARMRGRALSDASNTSKAVFAANKYRQALSRLERAKLECKALLDELEELDDHDQPEASKLAEQFRSALSSEPSKLLESYSEKLLALVAQKMQTM